MLKGYLFVSELQVPGAKKMPIVGSSFALIHHSRYHVKVNKLLNKLPLISYSTNYLILLQVKC